jgi:signal transduction histidine kinase/DNA-binding response OmpR family regulator
MAIAKSVLYYLLFSAFAVASCIHEGYSQSPNSLNEQDSLKVIRFHNHFKGIVDNQPNASREYLDSLRQIASRSASPLANYYYHQDLGYLNFIKHDLEASLKNYQIAEQIAQKNNWKELEISSTVWIAHHMYFQNKFKEARALYTQILNESEKIEYVDGIATAYTGYSYLTEDEEEVLIYLIKVDSVYHHYDTLSPILANAYGNIGEIYLETYHNKSEAMAYFDRSFELARKLNYVGGLRYIGKLMGTLSLEEGNLENAYRHFNESYELALNENDSIEIARGLLNLASVDLKAKDSEAAKRKLNRALPIFRELKDSISAFYTRLSIAKSELMQGRNTLAKKQLDTAKMYNLTTSSLSRTIDILEVETEYHKAVGNYRTALEKQQKLDSLTTVQTDMRNSEAFLALEKKFDSRKKEQQIELLRSENELAEAQRKNQRTLLIGLLVLLLLTGIIFFVLYRNRQKTHRKLKQLDKAKSTFFANISHEFKTPLTLIKGPLEDQIYKKDLTSEQRKTLQAAHKNTVRLENLVSQLLALSKLESGHFKLNVQPGNMPSFLAAQVEAFGFSSHEKNIDLQTYIDSDTKTDWFDRDALEKIIFNLMGNAVKYTSEGEMIQVHGKRIGTTYTFSVKNKGSFISEEELKYLFKRFYQTNPQHPGTGIGLALTKELVTLHHGTIEVKSSEDKTTEFSVGIPVSQDDYTLSEQLDVSLQERDQPFVKSFNDIPISSVTTKEDAPVMLIADDHAELRNYIASIFESEFKILTAQNGTIAFNIARQEVPDIVISDIMMPEANGYEFTKKCKTDEITSHIPVILLTAKTEDQDKLVGLELGADAYINKPFSSRLLKANVANLLETRRKLQEHFAQEVILNPSEISISSADELFLQRLKSVMDTHITDASFSTDRFSEEMAMSRMQLHRKLKALSGQSTSEFLRTQRLNLAAKLLKQEKNTVSEVAYATGFNDPSYFGKCFKQEFGVSPSEYIQK